MSTRFDGLNRRCTDGKGGDKSPPFLCLSQSDLLVRPAKPLKPKAPRNRRRQIPLQLDALGPLDLKCETIDRLTISQQATVPNAERLLARAIAP
jgi:hypothetical protein